MIVETERMILREKTENDFKALGSRCGIAGKYIAKKENEIEQTDYL